jgi:hypothetical protein
METLIQNRRCLGTDSNQGSTEYKFGVLSLYRNIGLYEPTTFYYLSLYSLRIAVNILN